MHQRLGRATRGKRRRAAPPSLGRRVWRRMAAPSVERVAIYVAVLGAAMLFALVTWVLLAWKVASAPPRMLPS